MISIIICSRKKEIDIDLFENIRSTVGCKYELIIIDNSENTYSIFEAYNLGIDKSQGNIICFIHDDIIFHTKEWGNELGAIFEKDREIGLIGVAGSKLKTKMPSGWWNCPDEFKKINIIQHLENKDVENWHYGFRDEIESEVVAIDGVFMAMQKDIRIRFNTDLKGFHNYDLNISLEYKIKGYKIVVTNRILIEHLSNGTLNREWYKSVLKIHKIYKKQLPLITNDVSNLLFLKDLEISNGQFFLNHMCRYGCSRELLHLWFKFFLISPFSKFHYKLLKKTIKISLGR